MFAIGNNGIMKMNLTISPTITRNSLLLDFGITQQFKNLITLSASSSVIPASGSVRTKYGC